MRALGGTAEAAREDPAVGKAIQRSPKQQKSGFVKS